VDPETPTPPEMVEVSTSVPAALRERIIAAVCALRGWREDMGIDQAAFARRVMRAYLYELLAAHEVQAAQQTAAEAKRAALLVEIGDINID